MPKEHVVDGTCIISLKVGKCLTAPTKRLARDLHHIAEQCTRIRNAIVRHWICWHWSHPDYEPKPETNQDGYAIHTVLVRGKRMRAYQRDGAWFDKRNRPIVLDEGCEPTPRIEDRYWPQELVDSWRPDSLYKVATRTCPDVAAKLAASILQEVQGALSAKVPFAGGKKVYEDILEFGQNPRTYKMDSKVIPVPTQDTVFSYSGLANRKLAPGVDAHVRKCGGAGSCVLRFPLFSRDADRTHVSAICRLDIRQLPKGQRAVLKRVALGEWPLQDSKLVYRPTWIRKNGRRRETGMAWCFQLTCKQPRKVLELSEERSAELMMNKLGGWHPFWIAAPADSERGLGFAKYLLQEYTRLTVRRKLLRHRYKTGASGSKHHGMKKFYEVFRPHERATRDMQDRYCWELIRDVIDWCRKNDCGTLLYREPGKVLRSKSWFAVQGVPFDWTGFLAKLGQKCWVHGIKLVVRRMSLVEHRERFGDVENPTSARKTQAPRDTGVADAHVVLSYGERAHDKAPLARLRIERRGEQGSGDAHESNERQRKR